MAHINETDANAFVDGAKLAKLSSLDIDIAFEANFSDEVIGSLSSAFNVSTWVDQASTPNLVRRIIAMKYIGWYFQRVYSENEDTSNYGVMLINEADRLLQGLITGSIQIPGLPDGVDTGLNSVSFEPRETDCTGPVFAMGQIF